jgi:Spy/CpxP family protein refolding chaperone
MKLRHIPLALMVVISSLLLLTLGGCSSDEVVAPVADQVLILEDPLDDVLKSTDGVTPAEPGDRLARLAEVLELDEAQLAALTLAYTEFRDGIANLHELVRADEMTREEARAAAIVLRETFEAELQIILTPEQWDLLQEMRQQRPRIQNHNHSAENRWTEWLTEIGADEAQITEILDALAVLRSEVQDLREEVRLGTLTRPEARDAMAVLRAEFDATLQTILTAEQYAALLELRPDCPRR